MAFFSVAGLGAGMAPGADFSRIEALRGGIRPCNAAADQGHGAEAAAAAAEATAANSSRCAGSKTRWQRLAAQRRPQHPGVARFHLASGSLAAVRGHTVDNPGPAVARASPPWSSNGRNSNNGSSKLASHSTATSASPAARYPRAHHQQQRKRQQQDITIRTTTTPVPTVRRGSGGGGGGSFAGTLATSRRLRIDAAKHRCWRRQWWRGVEEMKEMEEERLRTKLLLVPPNKPPLPPRGAAPVDHPPWSPPHPDGGAQTRGERCRATGYVQRGYG